MIKRLIIGLLGASVITALVALLGSESAQTADNYRCVGLPTKSTHCDPKLHCEYTILGQVKHGCFSADPGSAFFDLTLFGISGQITGKDCAQDGTCLGLKCSVFGTVDNDGGGCNPAILDPQCDVEGTAICINHGGNSSTAEGQPFTLETSLSETGTFARSCTKSGRCQQSLEVDAALSNEICQNRNWEVLTFVPTEFNGGCCTCDNGYDVNGVCCATTGRNLDDSCAIPGGAESCNEMRCELAAPYQHNGINPPYNCGPIPQQP